MKFFRTLIKPNQLALTPELVYENHDQASALAKNHLKWLAYKHNIKIQHADTEEGEKRIGKV